MSVIEGSVKFHPKHAFHEGSVFDVLWLPVNLVSGVYKTVMGICTLANLLRNPDVPLVEQSPRIQGVISKAKYLAGFDSCYPHIKEFYLPSSPIRYEKVHFLKYQVSLPLPKFPVTTNHFIADPWLNRAVLEPHRNVAFAGGSASYDAAFKLLQKVFPDTKFDKNDFLLTCGADFTSHAHYQILNALKGKYLSEAIAASSKVLVDRWTTFAKKDEAFDLSKEMRIITSAIITKVLFGNSEHHEELSEYVFSMNAYLYAEAIGSTGNKSDFDKACKRFREITNAILTQENSNNLPLFQQNDKRDFNYSLAKKQGMCLLMYFAGQETTAFALAHNLATLALDKAKQKDLSLAVNRAKGGKVPELAQFVNSQLMKISPVVGVSRLMRQGQYFAFETTTQGRIGKFIPAHDKIAPIFTKTVEGLLKTNSEATVDDATIFGFGANRCIGRRAALAELSDITAKVLETFEIEAVDSEFKCNSKVTMQAEQFLVKAIPK